MRWADVQHQERAISLLRRALRGGRAHHAYLFEGPEGVGKEMTARVLAARLLCQAEKAEPDADPCGRCEACRLFAAGNHPDFHFIHRGLHKFHPEPRVRKTKGLALGVDIVRHFLIEPAGNKPNLGRQRVFLVREAERMNDQAQNALLKTLEEPPGDARLILVTTSAFRLLPTIRSRCQRIAFNLLPPAFVRERLAALAPVDAAAARTLTELAGGRLGAALRWQRLGVLNTLDETAVKLKQLSADGDIEGFGKAVLELADALGARAVEEERAEETAGEDSDPRKGGKKGRAERGAAPVAPDADADEDAPADGGREREASADALRDGLKLVFALIGALYRDALAAGVGADARFRGVPKHNALTEGLARRLSPDQLEAAIRALARAEAMLEQNVAPQLACERLAAALSGEIPVG